MPSAISAMGSVRYIQKDLDKIVKEYDNKKGIGWIWQSLDSMSIKSPLGGGT